MVSERTACRVLQQPRSTQRYGVKIADDEEPLTNRIVEPATEYGRYGYRRITALLREEGWRVNDKRVERIWHQEGLKVPVRQPKRGRLWFNDGSCIRLRPTHKDHVWSYDIISDRIKNGRPLKMLTIIDEYTRECSTASPSSSCSGGLLTISGPTTDPSSRLGPSENGLAEST